MTLCRRFLCTQFLTLIYRLKIQNKSPCSESILYIFQQNTQVFIIVNVLCVVSFSQSKNFLNIRIMALVFVRLVLGIQQMLNKCNFHKSVIAHKPAYCRKGDPFQGLNLGSCLTLGNELSEETHLLTKQETLLGKGTRVERSRVKETRRTALPHGLQSWVLW